MSRLAKMSWSSDPKDILALYKFKYLKKILLVSIQKLGKNWT